MNNNNALINNLHILRFLTVSDKYQILLVNGDKKSPLSDYITLQPKHVQKKSLLGN